MTQYYPDQASITYYGTAVVRQCQKMDISVPIRRVSPTRATSCSLQILSRHRWYPQNYI
jgi:hypothetical protein